MSSSRVFRYFSTSSLLLQPTRSMRNQDVDSAFLEGPTYPPPHPCSTFGTVTSLSRVSPRPKGRKTSRRAAPVGVGHVPVRRSFQQGEHKLTSASEPCYFVSNIDKNATGQRANGAWWYSPGCPRNGSSYNRCMRST